LRLLLKERLEESSDGLPRSIAEKMATCPAEAQRQRKDKSRTILQGPAKEAEEMGEAPRASQLYIERSKAYWTAEGVPDT